MNRLKSHVITFTFLRYANFSKLMWTIHTSMASTFQCEYWHCFKADTHEGFCSRSMLQAHFARVSTHEGAFPRSLNLLPELAPKYLTC